MVALPGSLNVYDGPGWATKCKDGQLVPKGAEYHDDPFSAVFVRVAGAGERLRFYYDGQPQDAGMPALPDQIDAIRVLNAGAAYALAYFHVKDNSLGLAIWDV